MFYSSAFVPIALITHYLTRIDPANRKAILTGDANDLTVLNSPLVFIGSLAFIAVSIWIIVKLIRLIKVVYGVGRFRSLIVIGIAAGVEQLYERFVWLPFFVELMKSAAKT